MAENSFNSNPCDDIPILDIPSLYKMPLDQLLLDDNEVPVFIPVICEFLHKFTSVIGIFRLCGSHNMIMNLGVIFDLRDCAVPPCASVHDVTSFLKLWLRDLPEPLIPPDLINDIYHPNDSESIVTILKSMPVINRKCIAHIFWLIKDILDHQEINQMDLKNITTCFVTSLTQNSLNLIKPLPFKDIFDKAIGLLNEEKNDFVLPP